MNDNGNNNLEQIFSLTRSTCLNELIQEAKNLYEDDFDPDFYIDDYKDKIQNFKKLIEKVTELYSELQKTSDDTPVIKEQSEIIEKNFQILSDGLKTMEDYMEYNEKEKILEGLLKVKNSNDTIFDAIERIKDEEKVSEKHSKSPYVHELIRVAIGVIEKGFPKEALKDKLDWMLSYCDMVCRDFEVYKTSKCETEAISASLETTEKALTEYREGLLQLLEFFECQDEDIIKKAIPRIQSGSNALIDFYELVENELNSGQAPKHCIKCGKENYYNSKFCDSCSAILPGTQYLQEAGTLSINLSEAGTADESVMSSNIIRLIQAVDSYRNGNSSKEALMKIIDWLDEKVKESINTLETMGIPADSEYDESLSEARNLIEEGAFGMGEGLARMKVFLEDDDESNLLDGLEMVKASSQKLFAVQEKSKNALSI